jgi:hypothetical protein
MLSLDMSGEGRHIRFNAPIALLLAVVVVGIAIVTVLAGKYASSPPGALNKSAVTLSKSDVAETLGLSSLASIRRVSKFEDLAAIVGPETNLIVIDESAIGEVPTWFLYEQLKKGTSLMGINISAEELRNASRFERAVEENRLDAERGPRLSPAPPTLNEPGYSILRISEAGSEIRRFGQSQKAFSDGLFEADFLAHAARAYTDSE